MSTMTLKARKGRKTVKSTPSPTPRVRRETYSEPPEKAVIRAEQPESRWPSRSEAPDSGEFAGHFLENVFKNGRSKS